MTFRGTNIKYIVVFALVFGLAVTIFIWGATQQSIHVNTDMTSTDQSSYMNYAKNMAETNYQFVGGRNRMPVYPALMSLFYNEKMSDQEFFNRGKKVGITIGVICSIIVFFIFKQATRPIDAMIATFITMFTVFVYKSPYFQVEILFYTITMGWFYLLLSLLKEPKVQTAIFAGLVGGIGHLTKASVLPALILFTSLMFTRGILFCWRGNHRDDVLTAPKELKRTRLASHSLWSLAVFLTCFFLVITPYIKTSKERFGHYFYNVNSTFYMWYDSWNEVEQGTKAYGDRKGWPSIPKKQIPSLSKYIQEHSVSAVLWRIIRGYLIIGYKAIFSYGYVFFLFFYGMSLFFLSIQNKNFFFDYFSRQIQPFVLIFILGYFVGYTALYAWYTPIASGNRFILSLFLPAMFMILRILSFARYHGLFFNVFGIIFSASRINLSALFFLVAYLFFIFPHTIATMYGGG